MTSPRPDAADLAGRTIVLGVSGSIAAYKAADLCSKLVQAGARVLPILTRGALSFVGAPTFHALTREPVSTGTFDEPFPGEIAHLYYPDVADLFLIAPASANLLARLAAGMADDMLTSTLLARGGKPALVAPAMNTEMWRNPATEANRRALEARGYRFLEPGVGRLAEGIVGPGRLPEPAEILDAVRAFLNRRRDLEGVSVLVTAGPTREAIDPVRYISNRSSGKMGYAIAAAAAERGASVTLVTGPVSLAPPPGLSRVVPVTTAEEMLRACEEQAPDARVVVAAAAVADYAPETTAPQKMKKTEGPVVLTLRSTVDILRRLGESKRPGQVLVGFAAETERVEEHARGKLVAKNLDWIVANDVAAPGAGFEVDTNIVTLIGADGTCEPLPLLGKRAVADALWNRVAARLPRAGGDG